MSSSSVAVDMSTPQGAALVRDLAKKSDIVMENNRGGVVEKWGLDYESVRRLRDDVLYLSSQGLGRGTYDNYQTFGPNLQTFSGVTWQWSHPDDPFPVGTTLNHPDHMAGKQALVPLLAALLRRLDGGGGAQIGEQLRNPLADNPAMEFVTFPACGHFWHECPDVFYEQFSSFLERAR